MVKEASGVDSSTASIRISQSAFKLPNEDLNWSQFDDSKSPMVLRQSQRHMQLQKKKIQNFVRHYKTSSNSQTETKRTVVSPNDESAEQASHAYFDGPQFEKISRKSIDVDNFSKAYRPLNESAHSIKRPSTNQLGLWNDQNTRMYHELKMRHGQKSAIEIRTSNSKKRNHQNLQPVLAIRNHNRFKTAQKQKMNNSINVNEPYVQD